MNPSELILNFVNLYNHPFTADLAAEMTGQDIGRVQPVLDTLLRDQTIKLISPEEGIYVRSNRFNPVVGYKQKGEWRFDPVAARALLDLIEQGQYKSIRAIAKSCGRSRQWVFVYMEAMASLGMIGLSNKTYIVLNRDKIEYIGSTIVPGALGALRPKLSEEEKQFKAAEKEARQQLWVKRAEERAARLQQQQAEKDACVKTNEKAKISRREARMMFHEFLKNKVR